ncbi:hypothetical protein GOODEAATRI_011011, partial [Goodea atripinnis]
PPTGHIVSLLPIECNPSQTPRSFCLFSLSLWPQMNVGLDDGCYRVVQEGAVELRFRNFIRQFCGHKRDAVFI